MISFLILTSEIVRRFWNKKVNKGNKVGVSNNLTNEIDITQLINNLTISKQVTELRTRLLLAIGEPEKIYENGGAEKNNLTPLTQKSNEEILKDFLLTKIGKDGKLPSEKEMIEETGLSEEQLKIAKKNLTTSGFLYKENARVLKLNPDYVKD